MKKSESGNYTVYEGSDPNSLHDYSQTIAKELENRDRQFEEEQETQNITIESLQKEKAELEKELKEAQEDFYQNSIRGQANGEYIHVEDSSNCRARIGTSGNHGQETREGYQLLNLQSGMQNGITYYVDDEGYFCISGTCTSDRITLNLNELVLNGTYIFTNKSIRGEGINCALKDNTSEYKNIFFTNNSNETKEVNTILKDLVCYLTNGATYNSKIKLMLVSGSQEKDIEQYGASPSLNYPSEIKTVGSNVNLLENKAITQTINGVTFTVNKDGSIMANGTSTSQINLYLGDAFSLEAGTYLLTDGQEQNESSTTYFTYIDPVNCSTVGNKIFTIDIATNIRGRIVIRSGQTLNNVIFKPKLEKGTVATPYSPYGMGSVKINVVNKNLFDDTKVSVMTLLSYSNGIYSASDNDTNTVFGYKIQQYDSNRKFISLAGEVKQNINKPGIYYFTAQKYTTAKYLRIGNIGATKEFQLYYPLDGINAGDYYTVVINIIDTTIGASKFKDVMLLKGKITSASYIEHKSQTAIMPIQQEMLTGDYISDKEYHNWNKYVFTGEENIDKSGVEVNNSYWINQNSIPDLLNAELLNDNTRGTIVPNFLSTHFKTLAPVYAVYHNNIGITLCANNANLKDVTIRFGFGLDSDINTVDKCKAWLKAQYDAGTPVVVYYKLATSINLELTEGQKAVAKELNNARTYKNITNITTDSKAILSLDYAKDLETLLTSKESEV